MATGSVGKFATYKTPVACGALFLTLALSGSRIDLAHGGRIAICTQTRLTAGVSEFGYQRPQRTHVVAKELPEGAPEGRDLRTGRVAPGAPHRPVQLGTGVSRWRCGTDRCAVFKEAVESVRLLG